MYDFYPEWGPSRHRDADTASTPTRRHRYWQPTNGVRPAMAMAGADSRDGDRDRPDDN